MQKTIFVDFDGVMVINVLKDFNISKNEVENAKILQKETRINLEMVNRITKLNIDPQNIVKFLTGRKEYLLGDCTKKLLQQFGIRNEIIFYPKERGYGREEYFGYKRNVVETALKTTLVDVYDDDLKLLQYLKSIIPSDWLVLIYYEYTLDEIKKYPI